METWIHLFARTLSLLVKGISRGNANGTIAKRSSSRSSDLRNGRNGGDLLVATGNRPARIRQRRLGNFLEKMFPRRRSSGNTDHAPGNDEDDSGPEDNNDSDIL